MPTPLQPSVRNRLLALMSEADFTSLAPHLEWLDLPQRTVLGEPGELVSHAYFFETGVGSMVAVSPEGLEVEAGLFGRDALAPTSPLMGSDSGPTRLFMQVGGGGWRIAVPRLIEAVEASPPLRALLLRYVQTLLVQTSYTALSNAVHPIDERLARWILMCHDRLDGNEVALTHEFLSITLAVRRPSVTTSLHVLEGNGFIRAERGCIIVRDRAALERFAGDAYGRPEAAYRELIGPMN